MAKELYSDKKLLVHRERLEGWLNGNLVYPVHVDFDLTNHCNNYCPLCVTSLKGKTEVEHDRAKGIIDQLRDVDVRAIVFGGGGEPSCNPNYPDLIRYVKNRGMDIATFTNGYELSDKAIDSIVDCCTWMRVSLDADGPKIYQKTHGMKGDAFSQVVGNIEKIVNRKVERGSNITVGVTYLLGKHTIDGIYNAARLVKNIGVDYIRFRPFLVDSKVTFTPEEETRIFAELEKCKEIDGEGFTSSYPKDRCSLNQAAVPRDHKTCGILNFVCSITSDLKVYPCCVFKNNRQYCVGDLNESSFKEIWTSEKRRKIIENVDLSICPNPCQFEGHNRTLHRIEREGFEEFADLMTGEIAHPNFL